MTEAARINSLAPWYGAKRTLAPLIVEELGPHRSYWEPFCGSMAVLLAKPLSSHEHVTTRTFSPLARQSFWPINDLHGDLINLSVCLQDDEMAPQLYERCARTLHGNTAPNMPDLDRAYHFIVASWMGRNGVAGTKRNNQTYAVRWTPGGGGGGTRWRGMVESIPFWHERLHSVTILNRCAGTVLENIEDETGVAIYCDPTYLLESRSKGGTKYEHELLDAEKEENPENKLTHQRLAELLCRFKTARVVVSYYEDPRLPDLYPEWTKRSLDVAKNLSVHARRGSTSERAPEVLLLNGPSYAKDEGNLLF